MATIIELHEHSISLRRGRADRLVDVKLVLIQSVA
jgi:hypothetical protein